MLVMCSSKDLSLHYLNKVHIDWTDRSFKKTESRQFANRLNLRLF